MMPHEWNHLMADVLVVHALHPAPVERMRAAVRERISVGRIDAEHLHAPGVDELADRANQTLTVVFPFVAAAGREGDHRRAPMPEYHHAHVAPYAIGMPAVSLSTHPDR